MKQSLKTAEQLVEEASSLAAPSADFGSGIRSGGGGGMAGDAPSGGPGGFDLASMMNNPALMNMAQNMMQNPQMASMFVYKQVPYDIIPSL